MRKALLFVFIASVTLCGLIGLFVWNVLNAGETDLQYVIIKNGRRSTITIDFSGAVGEIQCGPKTECNVDRRVYRGILEDVVAFDVADTKRLRPISPKRIYKIKKVGSETISVVEF